VPELIFVWKILSREIFKIKLKKIYFSKEIFVSVLDVMPFIVWIVLLLESAVLRKDAVLY